MTITIMEQFPELVYQFFHGWIFTIILSAALVNSVITFRSYMIKRAEKNEKELGDKGISLFLSAGAPFIGWGFYSMAFEELGFDMLNVVVAITFSLFAIAGLVSYYDQWKAGQRTLDKYM